MPSRFRPPAETVSRLAVSRLAFFRRFCRGFPRRLPRAAPLAGRALAAPTLLALAAILALAAPSGAHAQTEAIVGNIVQTPSGNVALGTSDVAQAFTTGAYPAGGATLTSIDLDSPSTYASATTEFPAVTLRTGSATGTVVATLTRTGTEQAGRAINHFGYTPSTTVTLSPSTTYWVVAEGGNIGLRFTNIDSETSPLSGWSIANVGQTRGASDTGAFADRSDGAFRMRLTFSLSAAQVLPPLPAGRSMLVHNLNETATSSGAGTQSGTRLAQVFRTGGSTSDSYTLQSVEVGFGVNQTAAQLGDLTAQICTLDASDHPETCSVTLVKPSTVSGAQTVGGLLYTPQSEFTAPPGTTLTGGTSYALTLSSSGRQFTLIGTASDAQTAGVSGFTLDNAALQGAVSGSTTTWSALSSSNVLSMRVNGRSGGTTTNAAPTFTDGTSTTRDVPENTAAGTDIGAAVGATDTNAGDTLTYSLTGTDAASFDIDTGTGQLKTKTGVTYNHEATKNSYSVTVGVDDGNSGTDSIAVTVNVTDVAEKPSAPAAPTVVASQGSSPSLRARWTAPANTGPPISNYSVRYRQGASGSFTDLPANATSTTVLISGLTEATSYQVQARAYNDEEESDWSASGTGATAGVIVSATMLTVAEESNITYTVKLHTDPGDDVSVVPSSSDADAASVFPVSVTFTTDNWDTLQTFTVFGEADIDTDNETVTITNTVGSAGGSNAYATVNQPTVTVTVTDNDTDTTAPALDSASINGRFLTLTFDENLKVGPPPNGSAFTVKVNGTARTPASVSGGGSKDVDLTLASAVAPGDTVTVSYVKPSSNPLQDAAGNETANFTDEDVTNDTPGLIVSSTALTVVEDAAGGTYTVKLATLPTGSVTVTPTSPDTGAVTLSPTTALTFTTGNWNTAQSVTVSGEDDSDTNNESVTVTHAVSGYTGVTSAPSVAVTVTDDDAPNVLVSPTRLTVDEGSSGTYTVTLATLPTGNVTVTPTSGDTGAATLSPTAALTFTTGNWNTAQTVTVSGEDDTDANNETVTVSHTVSGYTGVTAVAPVTVTVTDDDNVVIGFGETGISVNEGAGTATVNVQVLKGTLTQDITLTAATANGTAVQPGDYTANTTTVNFSSGATVGEHQVVTIAIADDSVVEGAETFTVNLSGDSLPANIVLRPDEATFTITDNDGLTLGFNPNRVNVDEDAGTVTVNIEVFSGTLSPTVTLPLNINTMDGSATVVDGDYTALVNQSVTFANGATVGDTRSVTISITDDSIAEFEPTEIFFVNASVGNVNPRAKVDVTVPQATISIIDDEVAIGFDLSIVSVNESAGTATLDVKVLNNTLSQAVTLTAATADGTATQPADYTANTTTVNFSSGATVGATQTVTIAIIDDNVVESDEWFKVNLTGDSLPADVVLHTSEAIVTITESAAVLVSPTALTVDEGSSGTYTVTLATLPTGNVTVTPALSTAHAMKATLSPTTALTFTTANWNTAQTVTVSGKDDTDTDDETVTVTHTVSGYTGVSSVASVTVTVTDDDSANTAPTVADGIADRTVVAGTAFSDQFPATAFDDTDTLTYTATLTDGSALPVWFVFTPGTRTFAGTPPATEANTSFSVRVTATDTGGLTATDDFVVFVNAASMPESVPTDGLVMIELDSTSFTGATPQNAGDNFGQDFTTGPHPGGYRVTSASPVFRGAPPSYSHWIVEQGSSSSESNRLLGSGRPQNASMTLDPGTTYTYTNWSGSAGREIQHSSSPMSNGLSGWTLAKNGSGFSFAVTVRGAPVLAAPASAAIQNTGGGTVTLVWSSVANAATGEVREYRVESCATGCDTDAGWSMARRAPATTVSMTSTAYRITGLTSPAGTRHRVRAFNGLEWPAREFVSTAGVVVSAPMLTVDEGGAGTYTVELATAPAANVTVTPASGDDTKATVSGALTFTTMNWSTAQTVTVTGANDTDATDESVTVSHAVSGTGDYASATADPVTVTVIDDGNNAATGKPAISGKARVGQTLTASVGTLADADGLPTTFPDDYDIMWTRENADGTNKADISGATSGTYTPVAADMGKKIRVNVTFTDNAGNSEGLIESDAWPGTGTVKAAVTVSSVAVTSTPAAASGTYGLDEKIRFTVTFSEAVNVSTGANQPHFEFSLGPSGGGVVKEAAYESGSGETALVFAYTVLAGDMDPNGIWIGDQDDTLDLGTGEYIRAVSDAADAVLTYTAPGTQSNHKVNGSLALGVVVDPTTLTVVEEAAGGTYTVKLGTQPSAGVTVTPTSGDTGAATLSTTALTFSTTNWSTAQTVTVTGVADTDANDETVTVTHAVTSTDSDYAALPAPSVTVTVDDDENTNSIPTFTEGASTTRDVPENTAANTNIGTAVAATDSNTGDTLTYSLTGTDAASFDIDTGTGQLKTKTGVTYNHEATKNSYSVTVGVDDGNSGTDSIAVTVNVTDVAEKPGTPGTPAAPRLGSPGLTHLPVAWNAPANTGPPIGEYNVRYRQGASGSFTDLPANATSTSAVIRGLTEATSYQVQVRALNGELPSDWSASGTLSTAGVIVSPTTLTVAEEGTDTYTVRLTGRPSVGNPVTVTPVSADTMKATVSGRLTFTDTNWSTAQTVTVTGANDTNTTNETVAVTHTFSGSQYGPATDSPVTVTVTDSDTPTPPTPTPTPPTSTPTGSGSGSTGSGSTPPPLEVTLSLSETSIGENGGSAAITATLNRSPASAVTVTVTAAPTAPAADPDAPDDFVLSENRTLTILAGETASEGAVTLTAVDNAVDQEDRTVTISGAAAGAANISGPEDLTLVIVDDDTRGVTVSADALRLMEGGTGAYTVTLTSEPAGTVTILPARTSGDAGIDVENAGALTFAPENWDTPQTVTVTAAEDDDPDDGRAEIGHAVSGADYEDVTAALVTVTVEDDEVESTRVDLEVMPDTLDEGGGTAALTVTARLDSGSRDTDTVIALEAGGGTALAGTDYTVPAEITLTIADGELSATGVFALTPVDDDTDEADETLAITGTTAGLTVTAGTVTIVDDDATPTVTLTLSPSAIGEDGGEATITAALDRPSGAETTVTVSAAPAAAADAATAPATADDFILSENRTLTIAAGETASEGEVTLTAVDNAVDGEDAAVTVSADAENALGAAGPEDASLTIIDDDMRGAAVSATALELTVGGTARYTVALESEPAGPVRLEIAGHDGSLVSVEPALLEFSANDWMTPREVRVSAKTGSGAATLTHAASGGGYDGVDIADVAVTVIWSDEHVAALGGALDATGRMLLNSAAGVFDARRREAAQAQGRGAGAEPLSMRVGATLYDLARMAGGGNGPNMSMFSLPAGGMGGQNGFAGGPGGFAGGPGGFAGGSGGLPGRAGDAAGGMGAADGMNAMGGMDGMSGFGPAGGMGAMNGMDAMSAMGGTSGFGLAATPGAIPEIPEDRATGTVGFSRRQAVDWNAMLWGRSFAIDLDAAGNVAGNAAANAAGDAGQGTGRASSGWTLWGVADLQTSQGGGGDSYEGELRSVFLGADRKVGENWRAGLAVSRATGEVDYRVGDAQVRLDSRLANIYPYMQGAVTESLDVWAVGGVGNGEADALLGGSARESGDLDMRYAAAGFSLALTRIGRLGLSMIGDAGQVSLSADNGRDLLRGLESDASRLRLGVEGQSEYGALRPFWQLSARADGGSGPDATGLDLVAGMRYAAARVNIEAQGRWFLLSSLDGHREFSATAVLTLTARADGSGLALKLSPAWGEAVMAGMSGVGGMGGGGAALWERRLPAGMSGMAGEPGLSFDSEIGYGFHLRGGALVTPALSLRRGVAGARDASLGVRYDARKRPGGRLGMQLLVTPGGAHAQPAWGVQVDYRF